MGEVGHLGVDVRWDIYNCRLRLSNNYLLNVIYHINIIAYIFVIKLGAIEMVSFPPQLFWYVNLLCKASGSWDNIFFGSNLVQMFTAIGSGGTMLDYLI